MNKGMIVLTIGCFLMLCAPSVSYAVIFSDGDFNSSDWTAYPEQIDTGGDMSTKQELSGGNPDAFRKITNTVNGAEDTINGSGIWGFHYKLDAVYDPSVCPIASINYWEDSIMFEGFGQGQGSGIALRQNVTNYYSTSLLTNQDTWTTQSILDLAALNFRTLADPNNHPDFSEAGNPILFGFRRANSTRGNGYTIIGGIDNWKVQILCDDSEEPSGSKPIPEPGTIILLGLSSLGMLGLRKFKV